MLYKKKYNILHCLVILPADCPVADRLKCQLKKCLSHTVEPVKQLTFGTVATHLPITMSVVMFSQEDITELTFLIKLNAKCYIANVNINIYKYIHIW